MGLAEQLAKLTEVAERYKLSRPYICGGVVRDLVLAREAGEEARIESLNDVDITTGSADVQLLADLFAGAVGKSAKTFADGHKQVHVDGISFDFSTNFMYEGIDELLKKVGIDSPTDLQRETFSRDFTINALLLPLDFSEVVDLTGKGMDDLKERVLRCPLDSDASFAASPNRLIRAWELRARFGLSFAEDLRRSIERNLDLLKQVSARYAGDKLNDTLRAAPELLDELIESGFLQKIKLTKFISRLLISKRRIKEVL